MISVEEAQRIITVYSQPLETTETNSLEADGLILADDILAPEHMPDVAKSTVDGYALRTQDGLAERRVLTETTAGSSNNVAIMAGTAVRIMTGAPIPEGADAVVMLEDTIEYDGILRLKEKVTLSSKQNIREAGEDIVQGETLLTQGTTLRAAEIGLLAAVGCTRIRVYRRPRIAVLSTGNEVVEPDAARSTGMVRDSNRYALMALVREAGCEVISLGIVVDDIEKLRAMLLAGIEQADVVITSGGASVGSYDLVKPLLNELGTIHFGRTASKPGKPVTFATVQNKLVFGLSGFPVSSLVSFEVFVRPALRRLQGDVQPERPKVRVMLAEPIRPPSDRPEYQRVTVRWKDGRLIARSTGIQNSTRLLSLRGANALLIVPVGERVHEPGEELDALLIGPLIHEKTNTM